MGKLMRYFLVEVPKLFQQTHKKEVLLHVVIHRTDEDGGVTDSITVGCRSERQTSHAGEADGFFLDGNSILFGERTRSICLLNFDIHRTGEGGDGRMHTGG